LRSIYLNMCQNIRANFSFFLVGFKIVRFVILSPIWNLNVITMSLGLSLIIKDLNGLIIQ